MASHDISSTENNAMYGAPTAWNVFNDQGYNWAGYTRQDYIDIGVTNFDD